MKTLLALEKPVSQLNEKGVYMKMNAGKVDRTLRVILGLGLLSTVFFGPQTLWGLVGVVPLLTGAVGYCPLYQVFGFTTCPLDAKK